MRRFLVWLALVAILAAGCGTAKINLHTIVKSSGDVTQEVSIEATGMLAEALKESADPDKAKAEGWKVTSEEKENSFVTKMSRDFKRDELLQTPFGKSSEEGAPVPSQPKSSFKVSDNLFRREYEFRLKLPGSEDKPPAEIDEATKELTKALMDIFKVSWSITLPGEIVETNADTKTATTATWNFTFDTISKAREMVVRSQETNWVYIGAGAVVAVLIIALVIFLLLRRRAPAAPAAPASSS